MSSPKQSPTSSGWRSASAARPWATLWPMTTMRLQWSWDAATGLPADACTNTWHFISTSVDPVVGANQCIGQLNDLYDAIKGFMSGDFTGDFVVKAYDLSDPEPRVPVVTLDDAFTFSATDGLPTEVAVCLSYHALPLSGAIAARLRGRIFIGPLALGTMDSVGGQRRVDPDFSSALTDAASALIGDGTVTEKWAVFSPTTAGAPPWSTGELLAATSPVVGGYVDNAFDTVRSRGVEPTIRDTFS